MEHVEEQGSSDEKSGRSSSGSGVAEIQVEVEKKSNSFLIRIHCNKQKGALAELLRKVESLNLTVVNTSVTPFGTSYQDITIVAEMEKGIRLSGKEVEAALRPSMG